MNRQVASLVALIALPAAAQGQPPPDYGFNFITIGDVGNAAYDGPDEQGVVTGRGSVGYEYRMARTEITSGQYIEFFNGLIDAGIKLNLAGAPLYMGGTFNTDTGRWEVSPEEAMLPVIGIGWRDAAVYVNWLHNDKVNTLESFTSGAYDVSTFNDSRPYTDQTTRSPGAKYWIPSLGEWMKASHYDPNKNGQGNGGWWLYSDSSDTQPLPGLPGEGESSAGLDVPNNEAFAIPLESYPETQSPWGLLDTSGGGSEWTEEWRRDLFERRVWQGNSAGTTSWDPFDPNSQSEDQIWKIGSDWPTFALGETSFRVASLVPAPGVGAVGMASLFYLGLYRRRIQ